MLRQRSKAALDYVGVRPMGPERIRGTFSLTRQEEADEMIKRITAMKTFLKPGMKRPEAAYNTNTTKTNAPIRTIVPATMTTKKNLAISSQRWDDQICCRDR
jgi:hypothetical protein